ncbi:MAG TPA: DeoR/GlpR family DNA-binding transcription regulator [Geminicoccus sp.]|jgi:DeoR family glycerol-3-phosphate regulon repressor|uniref:DeoR/GlpR family DNA-binding transcription regulator n=1 Tax=Geminicoccus sp. TaxID=2024832 RepID=UPI002E31E4BF|nr:DeoR/GlpR family DNA-binding transcription regulator [Geminicoccus sp.]HEX2526455.1 DeoR/GlpR family DNA-binding transcription regulator [Geminicoccus sp.]
MYPTKWQTAIMATLRERGRCTITDLASELDVSDETIRRHVRALVEEGRLLRVHGAVALPLGQTEPPFSLRLKERTEAKRLIGRQAAAQVQDGQTVMIDGGSTTTFVAEALLERKELSVVTNSLEIARILLGRQGHRVFLAGGEFRADIGAAVGTEALSFIEQFRADLAILSIGAVSAEDGLMDFDLAEARIAQAMIGACRRTIVVADAAKLGATARVRVCGFDEIDAIVSDAQIPPPMRPCIKSAALQWMVAGTWPAAGPAETAMTDAAD